MYGGGIGNTAASSSTFDLANSLTAQANARWWEKKEVPTSVWQELFDQNGVPYYYNVETKDTTWDKPLELMTAGEMDNQGEWVWAPHETQCWVPARVVSSNAKETVVLDEMGQQHTYKHGKGQPKLEPMKRSSLQRVVSDLVLLDVMSAPLILHNLKTRFEKHEIYTNIGTILIAINPYCALPLYGDDIVRTYARRKLGAELPPHSFNIAHQSFVGLRDFNQNQSIIISGESGAGKTETTKHCLNYLAVMAGTGSNVANAILRTNPILEAFGNAKTLRNDNSSRFGKYMQIFFRGKNCVMSGCMVKNYLLEKIRVVKQTGDERNFHIFYMLFKGASAELKRKLFIENEDISTFNYLKQCTSVDTIDDVKDWNEMLMAFDELKFSKPKQELIFSIVAGCAVIGNITFIQDNNDYASVNRSDVQSQRALTTVSKLFQIDEDLLATALVTKELRIKNQPTTVMKLNREQSYAQRDALAKFIYAYLFDWIVQSLNTSIGQPQDKSKFIGCLDIFGFEIFDTNSFEQLCINFTNEMLQQHFNYQTFKLEEQVYTAEQIKFKHIEFIDNQPMLDLIGKRPHGLIPLLDEELIVPRGSDMGFLGKMFDYHSNNPVFQRNPKSKSQFMIKHYAGLVAYDVNDFLEKNRDTLTEDLIDMLKTTKNDLLSELFPSDRDVSTQEKKASLGSQFKRQLDDLMTTLRLTEPHYIRCIKPNPNKNPSEFIPKMCNEQLTYSGVFEAVAIRKAGYPFRLRHEVFVQRYSVLFDNEQAPGATIKAKCDAIIDHMKLNRDNVQMGLTMVLYRADEHKTLELHRNIKVRLTETQQDLERLIKINPSSLGSDAEREQHFIELAGAVRSADEFRLNTPTANTARKQLDQYVEERMDSQTKQMLQSALSTRDKVQIEKVLRLCEQHGYQTSLVRQCAELYEQICDCIAALTMAINEVSEDYLQRALAMADDVKYTDSSSTLLQDARTLYNNITKANEMIRRSLASLNHEHLRKTIEFCEGFNYTSSAVNQCKRKYNQIMAIRENLIAASKVGQINVQDLKKGIDDADDAGYSCDLVDDARRLHSRCVRINQEAGRAFELLNDDHIRTVLRAAQEVGLPFKSNKTLRQLKTLIDGPINDYYQAQYNASVKNGDHERAIVLQMLMTLEKIQPNNQLRPDLAIEHFKLLKIPINWGKEKFWGSSQYRADTMTVFNDAYVHSPLTTVFDSLIPTTQKELTEKVLLMYENIQKIMLCRKSVRIPQRTEEVLMTGIDYPLIRDEIYLGCIKMIRNNPVQQSIEIGWRLLTLCLLCFPPSQDFAPHLYTFILNPNHTIYTQSYNLVYLLTRIIYMKAITRPFWGARSVLADLKPLLDAVVPKQTWFYPIPGKSAVGGVTTYEDLKVRYKDSDYEHKAKVAYKKAKEAQRKGLATNAVPLDIQKRYNDELQDRKRGEDARQRGETYSAANVPPLEGSIHQVISQQISTLNTATTYVDNVHYNDTDAGFDSDDMEDTADDEPEPSESRKSSRKSRGTSQRRERGEKKSRRSTRRPRDDTNGDDANDDVEESYVESTNRRPRRKHRSKRRDEDDDEGDDDNDSDDESDDKRARGKREKKSRSRGDKPKRERKERRPRD